MPAACFDLPAAARYALRRVNLPDCLAPAGLPPATRGGRPLEALAQADLLIEDGRIAAVAAAGSMPAEWGPDLDQSLVLPGMLDLHTHLDKGHIWPRSPNPTGDAAAAAQASGADRAARWNAADLERRMEFGLMTAYAKGVVAIRTHLDAQAPQAAISFPVFEALRERWAGRIALQASTIAPLDVFLADEGRQLADIVARAGGQLGCMTRFRFLSNAPMAPEFDIAMGNLLRLAAERRLNVDLHVDESGDLDARTLLRVAQLARREGFEGDILCGHCCSLALQDDAVIEATLDACVEARIDVVSLPSCNMYLQGRAPGVTPRWRGVTLLHEMKARGLRVAVAGDNCRDPFYAYGDHDMLETFAQAVKILQLDHPLGDWIRAATATPAAIMGLPRYGTIAAGAPADLIVLRARDYSEMLSRVQADRVVLRAGKAIDTALPDYRLLDDLMAE